MKNTLIEELRAAEQEEQAKHVGDYDILVNSIAGGDEPDLELVQRTLSAAGRTADDLDRHVKMVRVFVQAEERVKAAKAEDYNAQLCEATEQRAALKQEREDAEREFKARDAELLDRIRAIRVGQSAASRAVAELAENKRALAAELRGEELPPEPVAPQPSRDIEVERHSTPNATKKPKGYDEFDPRWQKKYSSEGVISFWFNGNKVA